MKKLMVFALLLILTLGGVTTAQAGSGALLCVPNASIDVECSAGYATIEAALGAAVDGDRILVGPGNHAGAYLDKSVSIKGQDGAVIDSGPMHPAGLSMGFRLLAGSGGASISHLTFTVDLAIMNGDAVNNVEIDHNTFLNTIQAVSNWTGNGWYIHHNEIIDLRTRNGGGIGILIADRSGFQASNNVVSNNKIYGTLHVYSADGGGYAGSGIVLYSDHRWNMPGGEISGNVVERNYVALISDTPDVVDVYAFELTYAVSSTVPLPDPDVIRGEIFDNVIRFNNFRDTTNQIAVTPDDLNDCNLFIRNLGDNRSDGVHPNTMPND